VAVAEAQFRSVARVDEIPPGTIAALQVDGEDIAVANVGGEFFATQGHCLHLQGPLGEGRLEGPVLSCPWHGWQYDVRTGENEFDRAIQLQTYAVKVEDGEVKVSF
jgi:3-phenylpropionate/trans-cinnamate dioxygenase ferredoxin component